jgi:hypothetical protein
MNNMNNFINNNNNNMFNYNNSLNNNNMNFNNNNNFNQNNQSQNNFNFNVGNSNNNNDEDDFTDVQEEFPKKQEVKIEKKSGLASLLDSNLVNLDTLKGTGKSTNPNSINYGRGGNFNF